jgi:hypothetical protein
MPKLVSKDEPLRSSAIFTGYLLLEALRSSPTRRLTLADAASRLRSAGVPHTRPLLFGAMFLYAAGLVEFDAPYLVCNASASDD